MSVQKFISVLQKHITLEDVNVILDIGSRDCDDSVSFLNIFPNSQIYAFEPNPECWGKCEINTQINKNIQLIKKGVFNLDGNISFYPIDLNKSSSKNIGASSFFKLDDSVANAYGWKQKECNVECVRIDTFVKDKNIEKVDLVWMDTQGSELFALQGMEESLENIRGIVTEAGINPYYYGQSTMPYINDYLVKNGFLLVDYWRGFGHEDITFEADLVYVNKKFLKSV